MINLQDWTASDAAQLKLFLSKCPHFLPLLKREGPKVSAEKKIEERAMSGSEVRGAEAIFDLIEGMTKSGKANTADSTKFIEEENQPKL